MKKIAFLFFLLMAPGLGAQSTFSNIFDYENINTKSFTLPLSGNNEEKFQASCINIANRLAALAATGAWNESIEIGNIAGNVKIKATKLAYTPFSVQVNNQNFDLRMIFVRPADNVLRPCVLLSPGENADFENWYLYLALGVADYVSRGYAVAFYENYNNRRVLDAVESSATYPPATNLPVFDDPEQLFYAAYQFGLSAAKYTAHHAALLKINTNQCFAGGASGGGFSAYALALAQTANFQHPIFNALGAADDKTFPYCKATPVSIQGIGILGSGLFFDSPKMGLFTANPNLAAVIWHGKNDTDINLRCCPSTPCANGDNLSICGGLETGERLCDAGVRVQVFINCPGGHLPIKRLLADVQVMAPFPAQPNLTFLANLQKDLQQLMDIQRSFAQVFKNKMNGSLPASCLFASRKPKDYPLQLIGSNWHLTNTAPCFSQFAVAKRDQNELGAELFKIYPNPSGGRLRLSANLAQDAQFSIWNANGQQLHQGQIPAGASSLDLDLDKEKAGVYFLRVSVEGKTLWSGSFVLEGK